MIQLQRKEDGYDHTHYVSIRGVGEDLDGENLQVNLGESVVCGRSRHCDWSLKRTPVFLKNENGQRDVLRRSLAWRTTSRRHVRITYLAPDLVDIENLSQNGTYVDGSRVDRIFLEDCRTTRHRIRLGPKGAVIELGPGSLPVDT
ncbi:MAG: FHA domain-containing protein [Planctomycetota bacterium]|jgi:pSer/pThr/pTyr-binding forkhead associated (FHA) protein